MAAMTESPEFLERLTRLEGERDIVHTMSRYGHALDHGDEHAFLDCWTEDAVLEWPLTGQLQGVEEIRRGFRSHTHAPERRHKHLMVEPLIVLDGDTATVTSMFVRVDLEGTQPIIHSFGRYHDSLVRCADGKWRFTRRTPLLEALHPSAGAAPTPP